MALGGIMSAAEALGRLKAPVTAPIFSRDRVCPQMKHSPDGSIKSYASPSAQSQLSGLIIRVPLFHFMPLKPSGHDGAGNNAALNRFHQLVIRGTGHGR